MNKSCPLKWRSESFLESLLVNQFEPFTMDLA